MGEEELEACRLCGSNEFYEPNKNVLICVICGKIHMIMNSYNEPDAAQARKKKNGEKKEKG